MPEDHFDLTIRDFVHRVAEPGPAPAGGAVAAIAAAMAAGLTAMSAGLSRDHLPEAGRFEARARALVSRAEPLAQRDVEAYAAVLRARRLPTSDPQRADASREALSGAAEVPLEVARVGVAVLELAGPLADRGNPALRADAVTACLLAAAAVQAAARMVEDNLADTDDPRREEAADLARRAGTTAAARSAR